MGGFPKVPILEDLELSRRLRQRGWVVTCRASVRVSRRRVLARPLYSTTVANALPFLARLGVPLPLLAATYGNVR